MVIPIITTIIKRYTRKRLRNIKRASLLLKKNNRLDYVAEILTMLSQTPLNAQKKIPIFFGKHLINLDLSLRQFLMTKLNRNLGINKAILYTLGTGKPLRYPLPKVWLLALSRKFNSEKFSNHLKIDYLSSKLLWIAYVFMLWCYGVMIFFKSLKVIFLVKNNQNTLGNYVYFSQLKKNNLPSENGDEKTHHIINWYLNWQNRAKPLDTLCHNIAYTKNIKFRGVHLSFMEDGMPILTGIRKIYYLCWSIFALGYALFMAFFGRYTYSVLLSEIIKVIRIKLAKKKYLARDYLFHNSNISHRPLWTYEVQKKGSRPIFYFYSTNCENFKTKSIYPTYPYPWNLLSWQHYLAWDKYQKKFILRHNQCSATIEITGPIWFSCAQTHLLPLPKKTVAVFDVQPRRISVAMILGAYYYIPKVVNQFLADIYQITREQKWHMAHKQKRTIKTAHPHYMCFINNLKKYPSYIEIDPGLSANTLIEKTSLVISIPFTSTALIAKAQNKISIYYDPSGVIEKDDRAAHGIPILVGINELRTWIKELTIRFNTNE